MRSECASLAQLLGREGLGGADPFEQFGLRRFEVDESAEHAGHVYGLSRVLGEPVIWLKVSALGWRLRTFV